MKSGPNNLTALRASCTATPLASLLLICCNTAALATDSQSDRASIDWQLGTSTLVNDARSLAPLAENKSEHELLYRKSIHLSATQVVENVEEITYYPTTVAVQNSNNHVVSFEAGVDSLVITEAAVLSDTNTLKRFDPNSAIIKDTDTYDVFTDDREVVIALPGLSTGAKALLAYTRITRRDGLQLPWAASHYPQLGFARRHVEISVTWDREVSAPAWHNAFAGFTCTESPRSLHCIAKNIEPAEEDKEVSYYDVWPQLQISTATTWEDIIQNELPGVEAAIADTQLLDETYDQLEESASNPIAPLWDFSAAKIRYVSFSAGEHSVQPHPVSKTITDLYGDCKDKSMVLLGLLRKQGLKASAALVSTQRYDPAALQIPAGNYFNHMVVCLQDDAGNVIRCLDPTDPHSGSVGTTRQIQGNVALLLASGSTPFAIPGDTYRWTLEVNTNIAFDNKGGQTETIKRQYLNNYGSWIRSRLAARTPQERQEWLLENYHDNVSTSADPEINHSGIEDIESPVTIITRAKFDDVASPKENLRYREPLAWIADLARTFKIENEHYYYDFPGIKVSSSYSFDVSPGWKEPQAGPKIDLATRYGVFTRQNRVTADEIVQVSNLELPARRLEVAEFESFNKFLQAILDVSKMTVNAKKVTK